MKTVRFFNEVDASRRYSACRSGPCQQGRRICPSPMACQLPERTVGAAIREVLLVAAGVCALALGVIFLPH